MTIDEAYQNYLDHQNDLGWHPNDSHWDTTEPKNPKITKLTKEQFEKKLLTIDDFNDKWSNGCTTAINFDELMKWLDENMWHLGWDIYGMELDRKSKNKPIDEEWKKWVMKEIFSIDACDLEGLLIVGAQIGLTKDEIIRRFNKKHKFIPKRKII